MDYARHVYVNCPASLAPHVTVLRACSASLATSLTHPATVCSPRSRPLQSCLGPALVVEQSAACQGSPSWQCLDELRLAAWQESQSTTGRQ